MATRAASPGCSCAEHGHRKTLSKEHISRSLHTPGGNEGEGQQPVPKAPRENCGRAPGPSLEFSKPSIIIFLCQTKCWGNLKEVVNLPCSRTAPIPQTPQELCSCAYHHRAQLGAASQLHPGAPQPCCTAPCEAMRTPNTPLLAVKANSRLLATNTLSSEERSVRSNYLL